MSRKDTEQSTNHGKLVNQPHEVIQWWYIMVPRRKETTFFSAIWATYWEFGGSSRPSMEILKRHNMWSIHTMGNQLGNNMWNMQSAKMFLLFFAFPKIFFWFMRISMDCDHQMRIKTAISTRCLCPSSSRPVAFSMARIERGLLNKGTRGLGGGRCF